MAQVRTGGGNGRGRYLRYFTNGKSHVRAYISDRVQRGDEKWEAAEFERLHWQDGWVPTQHAQLDIEYDGDWYECSPLERPPADWWNAHHAARKKELRRERRAV